MLYEGDGERTFSAARASVFDLRGARLASGRPDDGADDGPATAPALELGTGVSDIAVAPSTAIEREDVKVAAALSEGFAATYG